MGCLEGLDSKKSVPSELGFLYDRMAPITAREVRLHNYGDTPPPEEASPPDGEIYTHVSSSLPPLYP